MKTHMHAREQRSFAKATKLLRGLILLSVTTLASGQTAGVLYLRGDVYRRSADREVGFLRLKVRWKVLW